MSLLCAAGACSAGTVKRIPKSHLRFYFSDGERKAAALRAAPHQYLSARLAAKKALASVFVRLGVPPPAFHRIEVRNAPDGSPRFRLSGRAARVLKQNARHARVTLSHTESWGCALVAVQTRP